jgi:hypothetical protein
MVEKDKEYVVFEPEAPKELNKPTSKWRLPATNKYLKLFGYNNNLHFLIELALIALVISTCLYVYTYDIPVNARGQVCYDYYKALDPTSNIYKLMTVPIANIEALNIGLYNNTTG